MLHYDFENYTADSNIIENKGTLGSAFNSRIGGSIISTDYATGTNSLSLTGEGTPNGGYLQIPNFKWCPTVLNFPSCYSICFWFKKFSIFNTSVLSFPLSNVKKI